MTPLERALPGGRRPTWAAAVCQVVYVMAALVGFAAGSPGAALAATAIVLIMVVRAALRRSYGAPSLRSPSLSRHRRA